MKVPKVELILGKNLDAFELSGTWDGIEYYRTKCGRLHLHIDTSDTPRPFGIVRYSKRFPRGYRRTVETVWCISLTFVAQRIDTWYSTGKLTLPTD